jgi:hypothetical protein
MRNGPFSGRESTMASQTLRYTVRNDTTDGRDGRFDILTAWTGFTVRRMAAALARFSAGRILLHLLAMLGDRCVRFHVAGIIRELRWAAAPPYCLRLNRILAVRKSITTQLETVLHTASRTSYTCAAAAALLLTSIPSARASEALGYSFEAAAQEITQLFWLAETASACGWAQDAEATKFMNFSVRFLTAHLAHTHQQALASLVTEGHYKAELRRAAREGAEQNCANSRWRLGWLSYKAAAEEHETEY